MTRSLFRELTGEYPEDILGQDWENDYEDFVEDTLFAEKANKDKWEVYNNGVV